MTFSTNKPTTKKLAALFTLASLLTGSVAQAKAPMDLGAVFKAMNKSGNHISAEIVNLTTGHELVKVNETAPLNPASTIKLFTAYEALKRLGINYTFKTAVYVNPDNSVCVKGGGDPSFVMEDMYLLVQMLKRKGLESYSGKITLDSSVFDTEFYPEDRSDQDSERAYNAPIAGLNFNYNTISVFVNPGKKGGPAIVGLDFPFSFVKIEGKVTTGSSTDVAWGKKGKGDQEVVTLGGKIAEDADEWRKPFRIRDPNQAFGEALSQMLASGKVNATGGVKVVSGVCVGDPYSVYVSKPLSFIVQLMDKYSNNFIADSLVKMLDHEVNKHPGSETGGLAFIKTELQKIGIMADSKGRAFVSGSGLTLGNKISASDFITLLKQVHKEKLYLPELLTSLPIAGVDGTLKRKYAHTDVADRLRAKTGTLSGVQSLVGIYPTENGDWVEVAIIENGGRGIPEAEVARYLGGL